MTKTTLSVCTARKLIFAALDVAGKVPEKFVEVRNIICLLKIEETSFFKEYILAFLVIFGTCLLIV